MKQILIFFLFCGSVVLPQKLKGIVYENINSVLSPLPGVNVFWAGTTIGTTSDENGIFSIVKTAADTSRLVVSYVTFRPDTILVSKSQEDIEIVLTENIQLDEVTVSVRSKSLEIDGLNPIFTQKITTKELKKAACCNLSETFETNASVDVSYGDAVTGSKQIKLLGLDGKYGQIMTENIPNLRGSASAYGIFFIPGPWMESIQVSKGTASVINGFESTTGQINVEYKKSLDPDKLYADLFTTSNFKSDINAITSIDVDDQIKSSLFLHGEYYSNNIDDNGDSFIDHPHIRQLNMLNRWSFDDYENWHVAATLSYLVDERSGGQTTYDNPNQSSPYRSYINTERFQFWSKIGYMFTGESNSSVGFINMLTLHKQNSIFGIREYDSDEFSFYSNLILESSIFNFDHKVNAGVSLVYDKHSEFLEGRNFDKTETTPGVFFQYTYQPIGALTVIGGIRADHSSKYGSFITPRLHLRYSPSINTTFRATAGKGYRSANVIAENISLLSSSRQFIMDDNLEMEEAVNYGINLTQYIHLFGREMSINAEFYRTEFVNKVVVDIDQNSREVNFYNLKGSSYANNVQLEIVYELLTRLDMLGAVRFTDSKTAYGGDLLADPLDKSFKGILSLSYLTKLRLWQFDFTTQFYGKSRLPYLPENINPSGETHSPSYISMNTQATRYFKGWEIFIGIENVTNYTQKNRVISPDDPFGPDFDASIIWGPIEGRKIYLGMRLSI